MTLSLTLVISHILGQHVLTVWMNPMTSIAMMPMNIPPTKENITKHRS